MFGEASLTVLEPGGLPSDAPFSGMAVQHYHLIHQPNGLWCRVRWDVRWPSWYIPHPDIKFCRVGCLKTYYFFLSIFNPLSMSLSFALSCIFYISSALSPSPLNSIPVWPSAWAPQLLVCSHTNPLVYIGDAIKSKPSRGVPEREARVQACESNFNFYTHSPPFPVSTHFHFPRRRSHRVLCSLSFKMSRNIFSSWNQKDI